MTGPVHAPPFATAKPSPLRGWAALAVFGVALGFYRIGVAPGLLWGDSAEMQILAKVGGVAHSSGYPLYTLVAQPFVALLGRDPAFLANLFSATFSAATLALFTAFLLARGVRTPAVIAAVLGWGLSFTFWTTSHRAEVYSLATFVAFAGLWCTLVAFARGGRVSRLAAGLLLGLSLAGHLVFAPLALVAGLVLAWRVPRPGAGPRIWLGPRGLTWLADEVALLGVFLLGLSPYLYLAWADRHNVGLNYLHLLDMVQWPVSPVPEWFRSSAVRVWWLVTSRNEFPSMPFTFQPWMVLKNISDVSCLLALFELGPVLLPVAVAGVVVCWRTGKTAETLLLLAIAAAVIVFTLLVSGYNLVAVFLIPCFLVAAVFAAHGFDALLARLESRRGAAVATACVFALPLAGVGIANTCRLATYDHPLGPARSRVIEEDTIRQRGLIPTFAGYDEPRRFTESAATRLPDSALVISQWRELMALSYLQIVEHRRTDLTLQSSGYPQLLAKVKVWQQRYAPAQRPIVIVTPFREMSAHFDKVDTLRLATGQPVWIARTPLVRLDQPWHAPPPPPRKRH